MSAFLYALLRPPLTTESPTTHYCPPPKTCRHYILRREYVVRWKPPLPRQRSVISYACHISGRVSSWMPGARGRFAVCHLLATLSHACAYVPVVSLPRTTPLAPSRRPSQLALSEVTMEEPLPAAPVAAPELRLIATVGSKGSGLDQFEGPRHIAALPDGGVCVVDGLNQRVVLLDVEGCCTDSLEGLAAPTGVAVAGDLLYVAESTGAHRVSCRRLSDGKLLGEVGGLGSGDGELHGPQCVVLSGASTPRHAAPRHATQRNATQRNATQRNATPHATAFRPLLPPPLAATARHRAPPRRRRAASRRGVGQQPRLRLRAREPTLPAAHRGHV